MTFEQKFMRIKNKMEKASVPGDGFFAVQVDMTDPDCGGIFYIERKNGVVSTEPYDYYDRTAELTASPDALSRLFDGRLSLNDAIAAGKAAVIGNYYDVELLCGCLPQRAAAKAVKAAKETAPKAAKKAKELAAEAEKAAQSTAAKAVKAAKNAMTKSDKDN